MQLLNGFLKLEQSCPTFYVKCWLSNTTATLSIYLIHKDCQNFTSAYPLSTTITISVLTHKYYNFTHSLCFFSNLSFFASLLYLLPYLLSSVPLPLFSKDKLRWQGKSVPAQPAWLGRHSIIFAHVFFALYVIKNSKVHFLPKNLVRIFIS